MGLSYRKIVVAVDGSRWSKWAEEWALHAAKHAGATLIGLHVYAARLHRVRFEQMEPGLPETYQRETELVRLRGTHDALITDGLRLISDSYLRELHGKALEAGVQFQAELPEGRNYVEILRQAGRLEADLLVLGAKGLGADDLVPLGSVAERVLQGASCDVLIVRSPLPASEAAVLVGIDGSGYALQAAKRAAEWAGCLRSSLRLAAVYDPQFHTGVFRAIAEVLPEEAARRFDFRSQEKLHDEIIDRGLAHLYRFFLDQAAASLDGLARPATSLLEGKPFKALVDEALPGQVGLIVVGRHGAHREESVTLGSNALAVARYAPVSVLVTSGAVIPAPQNQKPEAEQHLP